MKTVISLLAASALFLLVGCQDQQRVTTDMKAEAAKEQEKAQQGGGGGRPMPVDGIDN